MELVSTSGLNLRELGRLLGERLEGGIVVVLRGELGAGKTTFAQGVAEGLGVIEHVTSPSFSLIHLYQGQRWRLVHCDFYRLRSPREAMDIGFLEYLGPENVVVVEWGDLFLELMPEDALTIAIDYTPEGRHLHIEGSIHQHQELINEWVRACQSYALIPPPK